MADFTNAFWDHYIVVLTILGIIGCAWLLWAQSKIRVTIDPKEKDPTKVGTTGHTWDEGLTEYNFPLPRWWMWMFYLTIVFSIAYLILFPGLGTFQGKLGWDSASRYEQEMAKANEQYGPLFEKFLNQDIETVAADPQAHVIGERLFMNNCAQCHGSDARGSRGFPNLADKDWLYGGSPEAIKTSIMKGRNGVMPPMAAIIGAKEVENVTHYVRSLSGATVDPIKASLGKASYSACIACHGADGSGNQMLGAPNLRDRIWLHGGDSASVMKSIAEGRNNVMPPFEGILGEAKAHVVAAYVWSLSNTINKVPEN